MCWTAQGRRSRRSALRGRSRPTGLLRADFEKLAGAFEDGLRQGSTGCAAAGHARRTDSAKARTTWKAASCHIARNVLGPDRPIVMSLDLHANITRRMVELADAIVGYHTYPHVDMFEVGQKAARLMLRILNGECDPAWRSANSRLIIPAENSQTYSRADVEADSSRTGAGASGKGGSRFYLPGTAVDGHRRDGLRRGGRYQW